MTTSSPYPPGWYDDQSRPGWQRWWDGAQWTTHVRHPLPSGQASQPPPPDPALQPRSAAAPGVGLRWRRPQVLVPAVLGAIALIGAAAVLSPPSDGQLVAGGSSVAADEVTTSTVGTTAVVSATTGSPTTEVATTAAPATEAPTTAARATAAPTTNAAPTTTRPTTMPPTTAPSVVPVKPLSSGCDPNYTGACVPLASDVDCAGGSGNGPAYVQGPVRVVGQDIYGLDGNDNDGIGCE